MKPADIRLKSGYRIRLGPDWAIVQLPNGRIVRARPNADSAASAEALGFGDDVAQLTRTHDPIHAILCNLFDVPSHSLMMAAGCEHDAVLRVQKWARAAGAI